MGSRYNYYSVKPHAQNDEKARDFPQVRHSFFPVERESRSTGKGESFLPGIPQKLNVIAAPAKVRTGQPDLSFWENACFFTEIFCQKPVTVLFKRLTRRLPTVPVRRLPRSSWPMHFGDVSEAMKPRD